MPWPIYYVPSLATVHKIHNGGSSSGKVRETKPLGDTGLVIYFSAAVGGQGWLTLPYLDRAQREILKLISNKADIYL